MMDAAIFQRELDFGCEEVIGMPHSRGAVRHSARLQVGAVKSDFLAVGPRPARAAVGVAIPYSLSSNPLKLTLRHPAKFGNVMPGFFQGFHHFGIELVGNRLCASHDPDVFPVRHTDDGCLVIRRKRGDEISCLEGPNELHPPLGVCFAVINEAAWLVRFQTAVEAALVELEGGGNRAVWIELITFDRVVGLRFDERRDVRDDIPVAHEFL